MIEVLVHPNSPLPRGEFAKEGMRMPCALRFTSLVKLPNARLELFLLPSEISLIGDHKFFVRRSVLGKRFVVRKYGADERAKYPANEQPRQNDAPGSHVEPDGTMGHHLGHIHLAPLVLGGGLELVDTRDHFRRSFGLKQILHF